MPSDSYECWNIGVRLKIDAVVLGGAEPFRALSLGCHRPLGGGSPPPYNAAFGVA